MKLLLSILVVFLVTDCSLAADLGQEDKQKHVAASAGIALASYSTFRAAKIGKFSSYLMSVALTMGVGHLKEKSDPFYDHGDIQADLAGTGIGLMIPLTVNF